MKKLLAGVFMIGLTTGLFAQKGPSGQSFKKLFTEATYELYDENWGRALPHLLLLDSLNPGNANLHYLVGFCYLKPPIHPDNAVKYLEKAATKIDKNYREGYFKEENAPIDVLMYLGMAYTMNYEFDIALKTYDHYKEMLDSKDELHLKKAEELIKQCKNAQQLVQTPINMTVKSMGEVINSSYADYAAVVSADESLMAFTSKRKGSTGDLQTHDGRYFEDIYISENIDGKWGEPKAIGPTINSSDHEATIGMSADGQTLLIYKYEEVGNGDIFTSKLVGDRWSIPTRLGSNINTEAWEAHASISADGNTLFFMSNREGGIGGTDIYFCRKLPTGDWGLAQNCGPDVNTPKDEDSPYIHPDGITLFFSSKGHNSMGGYDIFFSEKAEDFRHWTPPHNMGYPVNSTGDDAFFVPTADGTRAYYSSFKKDGYGDQDIYMINFPDLKKTPLTVYKGVVKHKDGSVPEDVYISVTDNETGEIVGNYIPNTNTGKYLIILPPGRNYNIAYEDGDGNILHSENMVVNAESSYYEINKAIELDELVVGAIIELRNIFFDFGAAHLQQESYVELDKIYKLLNNRQDIKVEIAGHTDSKGEHDFNVKLSQDRCQSVVDYLVEQGIDKERLVAHGYGETKPVAENQNEDGSDNPEGRAKNRRIEMKILEVGSK